MFFVVFIAGILNAVIASYKDSGSSANVLTEVGAGRIMIV